MREVVIVALAAFLIAIMVTALLVHFLPQPAAMTARRFRGFPRSGHGTEITPQFAMLSYWGEKQCHGLGNVP
jgi:hypothetical protein